MRQRRYGILSKSPRLSKVSSSSVVSALEAVADNRITILDTNRTGFGIEDISNEDWDHGLCGCSCGCSGGYSVGDDVYDTCIPS